MKARRILPVILLLFSVTIIAAVFFSAPWYVYVAIILMTLAAFVYGSAYIGSRFYLDTICSASTSEKEIAITFDDGPDIEVTPVILDILKKYEVQTAFFCVGKRILKSPSLLKRMDKEGHIIGNHSYSHHFFFDFFSGKQMGNEIRVTGNLIHRNIKKRTLLFRPPYGVTNPVLARVIKKTGHSVIGWSLKSKDTVVKDYKAMLSGLKKRLQPGDIILFHDTVKHLPPALEEFLKYVSENSYKVVRLDDLLNIKAYE